VKEYKTRKDYKALTDYDEYRFTLMEILRYTALLTVVLAGFSFVFYDSFLPALFLWVPALMLYLKQQRKSHISRRKKQLMKQFLSAGALLGDYLRSGYSMENAVRTSSRELKALWGENADVVREWNVMAARLSVSMTIEEAFREFAARTHVEEIISFSEVFSVVKRTGGQIGEAIAGVISVLQDGFAIEEQIETMVSAAKFEQKVMDIMPLGILLYVRLSAPDLVAGLYEGIAGRLIMTACLAVYIGAYLWAEKITDIRAVGETG